MRKHAKRPKALSLIAGYGWSAVAVGSAAALPIEFRHQGIFQGFLDEVPIGPVAYSIQGFGDTDASGPVAGNYFSPHLSGAIVELFGIGEFDILPSTGSWRANLPPFPPDPREGWVGMVQGPGEINVFSGPIHTSLFNWRMDSSIGPIFGEVVWGGMRPPLATSGGVLSWNTFSTQGSFTAIVTPEPSTFGLILLGGLVVVRVRRR